MTPRRQLRSVSWDRSDPRRAADTRRHPSGPPETDEPMIQRERLTGPATKRHPVPGPMLPNPRGLLRPPGRSATAPPTARSPVSQVTTRSVAPQAATRGAGPQKLGRPFPDAESCITWMVQTLVAEAEPRDSDSNTAGAPSTAPGKGRSRKVGPRRAGHAICTPAEVVKCLDTLYRRRRIDLHHVRILRLWGHRGRAPDAANPMEKADWRVWREALDRLEWPLRSLGIIS
jgi:hypothetical protein